MKHHYIDEKRHQLYFARRLLLPNLVPPTKEKMQTMSIWGQRHLRYLKQHRKVLYTNLLTSGKLRSYLVNIEQQAETTFFRLVEQWPGAAMLQNPSRRSIQ